MSQEPSKSFQERIADVTANIKADSSVPAQIEGTAAHVGILERKIFEQAAAEPVHAINGLLKSVSKMFDDYFQGHAHEVAGLVRHRIEQAFEQNDGTGSPSIETTAQELREHCPDLPIGEIDG